MSQKLFKHVAHGKSESSEWNRKKFFRSNNNLTFFSNLIWSYLIFDFTDSWKSHRYAAFTSKIWWKIQLKLRFVSRKNDQHQSAINSLILIYFLSRTVVKNESSRTKLLMDSSFQRSLKNCKFMLTWASLISHETLRCWSAIWNNEKYSRCSRYTYIGVL